MSTKHALIVDDSRIAQVKLRKMLARYDLEVTCVNSAEEALSYLSYKLPAVLFMDHMMQGMDGFEALRVIKSNPDTAMVPIIMYTSKTGDLYVGQARALGAIDVLTKDVIEPSNLDRVLQGVKIYPKFTSEADDAPPAAPESPARPPSGNGADESSLLAIDRLRAQIARMLEIHIVRIKQEIGDSNKLFMKRLFREIQEVKSRQAAPLSPPVAPASPLPREDARPHEPSRWPWVFLALSLVAMSLIVYQLYQTKRNQEILAGNYSRLNDFIETQYDELVQTNRALQKNAAGQKAVPDSRLLYQALAWSVNRYNLFDFGQQALGEEQLNIISSLVGFLHTANFTGTISVDVHFGNFCLTVDDGGKFVVPPPDMPVSKCQFIASRESDYALEDHQSWPFLNFLLTSPILQEGKIRIDMESHGIEDPPFEYPSLSNITKAGEWNKVAQMNQRVVWDITPD